MIGVCKRCKAQITRQPIRDNRMVETICNECYKKLQYKKPTVTVPRVKPPISPPKKFSFRTS